MATVDVPGLQASPEALASWVQSLHDDEHLNLEPFFQTEIPTFQNINGDHSFISSGGGAAMTQDQISARGGILSPTAATDDLASPRFMMDEQTTRSLAEIISATCITTSGGALPGKSSLQRYMDTYFSIFHNQFPLLHLPTFETRVCPGAVSPYSITLLAGTLICCLSSPFAMCHPCYWGTVLLRETFIRYFSRRGKRIFGE
jgi:hypothetical protein